MATLIPRNVSSQSSLLFKHIHENVTFYIQRVQFRRVWIYEWKTMPKYQHVSNWSPKINCMPHRDSILLVTQYCSVQFVTLNDWRCHITLARVIVYLLNNLKYEYTVVDNTRPGCGADCSREQHRCSPQLYPKAIAYDCFFWQGRTVWQDKRRGYQCHLVSFFFFFHKTKNIVLCGLPLEPVHQFLPKSLIWKGCLKYSKICLGRKEKFRLLQYGSQAKNNTHFHKKGCALGLILRVRVFGTRKWPVIGLEKLSVE